MFRNIITVLCILAGIQSFAQNLKTGVLVVGSGPSALAAAIQSANSGVKTLLIDAGRFDAITLSASDRAVKAGIYNGFSTIVDSLQKSPLMDSHSLTPAFTAQVFKVWTDTLKNLTVLPNASIKKLERSGKGWEVDLTDREIKADVLVDATPAYSIVKLLGINAPKEDAATSAASIYSDKKYRTSVALTADDSGSFKTTPLASFLVPEVENLVLARPFGRNGGLLTGQAAGATAAYCVFFRTSTKNLNVRAIQTELLSYKSRLIKFDDIPESDSSMIAFQHLGVTGILKAREREGKLLFQPDSSVSTEELKQPLRELYSRSQIWFLDNKSDKISLETALSLIKFVGSRGDELNREVEKAWSSSLKLDGKYDLKRPVTRRMMAVLLDTYLEPYTVAVDLDGNVRS